jgi:hypothetical protein
MIDDARDTVLFEVPTTHESVQARSSTQTVHTMFLFGTAVLSPSSTPPRVFHSFYCTSIISDLDYIDIDITLTHSHTLTQQLELQLQQQ